MRGKIKRDLSEELMEKWIEWYEIPTFLRKKWMRNETVEEEFVPFIKKIEKIKKEIEKLGGNFV
jgi:hypothetical protein